MVSLGRNKLTWIQNAMLVCKQSYIQRRTLFVSNFLFPPIIKYFHQAHDDVIKWKHFPRYWPFVRGIHRWPMNSPYKGQRRGALMFSLICAWINGWVNNGEAGDLRRHRAPYDVTVMLCNFLPKNSHLLPAIIAQHLLFCRQFPTNITAKNISLIFHLPGMLCFDRS